MTYKVQLGDEAKRDLRGIYEYVAFTLLEPGIARNLTRRIVDGLYSLNEMPERYPIYQEEPWESRGLRRMNIGKYSGFYLVGEKTVQVTRILYGGRDISSILKEFDETNRS
jgi:toxin ParE1/3/4